MENMTKAQIASTNTGTNIKDFEDKLKVIKEKNAVSIGGKFNNEQLMTALYYLWDAFDRASIKFFLIGKTGESCFKDLPLSGDKVEIGIRRMEHVSGAWSILKSFAEPIEGNDKIIRFEKDGVPVECKVFDDDVYFLQTVPHYWQYEAFNLPNPYLDYVEKYEKGTK